MFTNVNGWVSARDIEAAWLEIRTNPRPRGTMG